MISWEPMASISSRTMRSTFASTRLPSGRNVYTPDAVLRIMPARSSSLWLAISASVGSSLSVGTYSSLIRMNSRSS